MAEIKLFTDKTERELVDNLAELYSIIFTCEMLERAWIRDAVSAANYTPACLVLLAQFKSGQFPIDKIDHFMSEYRVLSLA